MVEGNFNAYLDKNTAKFQYHDLSNNNEKLMSNFVQENGFLTTNSHFQGKKELWTFVSEMDGSKT